MSKVHDDLREISRAGFIKNKFGGGNAGAALGGLYTAQAIDRLTVAIEKFANRPINITVQLPQQDTRSTRKPAKTSKRLPQPTKKEDYK